MSTSRLKIYNGALLLCGEGALASLTENREPRRLLDSVWSDGGVRDCLEQGQWNFAMRTSKMTADTDIEPAFGYQNAFAKPTDWVNTSAVCQDPYFNSPLVQYADEISYWFADINPIYVKYVSDDVDFGMNLGAWPYSFTEFVKAYFASKIVLKLSSDTQRHQLILGTPGRPELGILGQNRLTAKNRDAMAKPPQRPAQGSWSRARQGGYGTGRDGGNSGNLIG